MLQWHHLHRLGLLLAWLAAVLQAPAWLDFYTRDLGHAVVQAAAAAAPTGTSGMVVQSPSKLRSGLICFVLCQTGLSWDCSAQPPRPRVRVWRCAGGHAPPSFVRKMHIMMTFMPCTLFQ